MDRGYAVGKGSSSITCAQMLNIRYLSEESLEVQVWVSLTKRKLSEGPRPLAEDTLLGSAYVALNDIIHRENISGAFPLFKAGVDSLGVQSVHVEIHRMFLSNEATPHPPDTLAHQDSCIEVLVGD